MTRLPLRLIGAGSIAWLLSGPLAGTGLEVRATEPASAVAKSSAASPTAPRGGGTFRGRQFGFVPRHTHFAPAPPPATSTNDPALRKAAYTVDDPSAGYPASDAGVSHDPAGIEGSTTWITDPAGDAPVVEDGMGSCGDYCVPPPRLFFRADYLMWWTNGMELPALATSSPADSAQTNAGVLGQRGTSVRFGDETVVDGGRSGGQLAGGWWLDDAHSQAVEVRYLDLKSEQEDYSESNTDVTILARPFVNLQTGLEDARLIAFPGLVQGSLAVQADSDFEMVELLFRRQAPPLCWDSVDCSLGYRYASLEEGIGIVESTRALSGPILNSTFNLTDQFRTENEFNGGQFGMRVTPAMHRPWSLELGAKVALGSTRSQSVIDGQTITRTAAGATTTRVGGLLTQPSNIGTWNDSNFSTISEGEATLRRRFGRSGAFVVGYTFLYWTEVARVADQIDRVVDTTQIPPDTNANANRPSPTIITDNFWAQGLRLGLEFNY